MREAQPGELGEGLEEVRGQQAERRRALVEVGAHAVAEAVDGVVAAEQDAVVAREAVVVELVGEVGQALAPRPAQRRAPLRAERLADEHVVVDGDHVPADGADERGERAGRQHGAPGPNGRAAAVWRERRRPPAPALDRRALVNVDAGARAAPRGPTPAAPGRPARVPRAGSAAP